MWADSQSLEIADELQRYIRVVRSQDYTAARRFLRSLEYQVLEPSSPEVTLASVQ